MLSAAACILRCKSVSSLRKVKYIYICHKSQCFLVWSPQIHREPSNAVIICSSLSIVGSHFDVNLQRHEHIPKAQMLVLASGFMMLLD